MERVTEHQIYDVIGEEGFRRLIRAFYNQVPDDDILGPMYSAEDLSGAEQRLADFMIFRFGGPPRYIEERGHPRLRMRHVPFTIDRTARDRWIALMDRALDQTQLPAQATQLLRTFFNTFSTFLINRDEP